MRNLVAGTRGSALARLQTREVVAKLQSFEVRERIIATSGDTEPAPYLQGKLEKGWFSQELDAALLSGEIDFAVHSLKDLPTEGPSGIVVGAVLERAEAADLLVVSRQAVDAQRALPLAANSRVGSSSLRRASLLRAYAPWAKSVPLRGNVPTRIERLRRGDCDAVLLAEAGVRRLQLDLGGLAAYRLNPKVWLPAPGQGAIAVQCRADDAAVRAALAVLDDPATRAATDIERAFLAAFEGGCSAPFGCYAGADEVVVGLEAAGGWRHARYARAAMSNQSRNDLRARVAELQSHPQQGSRHGWLFQQV